MSERSLSSLKDQDFFLCKNPIRVACGVSGDPLGRCWLQLGRMVGGLIILSLDRQCSTVGDAF